MIKAIGLTLLYGVAVALLINHFFGVDELNNLSKDYRSVLTMVFSIPGVYFFMDYLENRENSRE